MWTLVLRNDAGGEEVDVCPMGDVVAPTTLGRLGMDRDMSRRVLASLQQRLCRLQETALACEARRCARTHAAVEIKDYRKRKVHTLFGNIIIRIPRLRVSGKTRAFVNWPRGARATPELDHMRVKLSAWMSYPRAVALLGELCPVDGGAGVSTAHDRVREFAWGRQPEPIKAPAPAQEVFLPIDTTFVKGVPDKAERSLEILVGAAEATRGKPTYFAAPLAMQTHCKRLGHAALNTVGRTSSTTLIAFTDGGTNVQRLARHFGPSEPPITDWFHISMRIRNVESVAAAFRAPNRSLEAARASIIRKIERLRLRLWHGKDGAIKRTLQDLAPDLRTYHGDPGAAEWKRRAAKLRRSIGKLDDYLSGHRTRVIDYGARQSRGRRVSTSLVEGGADFIVNARMTRGQHMRWSNRGAFQVLQARTADINGTLEHHFHAA